MCSGKARNLILHGNAGIGQICIGGGITGSERTRQPQNRLGNVERFTGSKLIVTLAVADDEPEVRTGFLSFDCPVPDAVIGVRVVIRVSPPALGDCAGVVFRILAISKTDDVARTVLWVEPSDTSHCQ